VRSDREHSSRRTNASVRRCSKKKMNQKRPLRNQLTETHPVVAITGASAGVGRATALVFGRNGWNVALIARGRDRLERARQDIEAQGGSAMVLPTDVADAGAVFSAADEVCTRWGKIDVWVNNAMATIFAPVDEITADEFKRVTEVTYLGQVHGTLAALKHMRPTGRGVIVQVGSALSYRSIPLQSAYCAAKFAVRGFTDSLRTELEHEGSRIRLTMVQLPALNTPQFDWARSRLPRRLQPVPPIYQPEAVAARIYEAAHTTPRELWIGLPTWKAVIGTMILPAWLDRLMAQRAWDGQMTEEPVGGGRIGNLMDAPAGDPGPRGRFDERSSPRVAALSGGAVRASLAALVLSAGAVVVAAAMRRARSMAPARALMPGARSGASARND
jgi:NAD(P)-dependent dehydrogenase (short-subunit alcohol dehydrogenase family)